MQASSQSLYTTRILKGGALLAETKALFAEWDDKLTVQQNLDRFIRRNPAGKASRSRVEDILAVLRRRYLLSGPDRNGLVALVARGMPVNLIRPILFFYTACDDRLLHDAVTDFLLRRRVSANSQVRVSDLEEWIRERTGQKGWSRTTVTRCARGVLSALRDFGILSGAVRKYLAPPGSPFAYWVSERIRRLFTELPPFEGEGRTAKQGLATADDFRFIRAWWEVPPEKILTGSPDTTPEEFRRMTFEGKRWGPFAKGGAYSPYYADIHLVVNWERNGEEMKAWADPLYGNSGWSRIIKSVDFYFRPGLTGPLRAGRFAPSILPSGSIFSVRGYAILASPGNLEVLSGLGNSASFDFIFKVLLGRFEFPEFIVGVLQRLPVPELVNSSGNRLAELATSCVNLKRAHASVNETCHIFHLPPLFKILGSTLSDRLAAWQMWVAGYERQLAGYQFEIDDLAFRLYGIEVQDRKAIEEGLNEPRSESNSEEQNADSAGEDIEAEPATGPSLLVAELLSYAVGCIFGRWDIRFATGGRQPPELPDPFAPLPPCSPGILTGPDGLPLRQTPAGYPLRIDWDGILFDDPEHSDDIVRRVRDVLEVIWKDRAEAIEQEACEIFCIRDLRDYFRKPGNGGFWRDHVRRYSKSRHKAPIYWLLQSSRKNYAVWIYYHRLNKDILFKALINYIEPKMRLEETRLEQLRGQRQAAGVAGRQAKELEKQLDRQDNFVSELRDFHDKLRRAADLNLAPDLNDGAILNLAPLWELVPWPEPRKYWEELIRGKYDWSMIGRQVRGMTAKTV